MAEFHLPEIPEEEVQRFMIAEDLTECERVKLLLHKREPSQFSYVFLNAVNIFRDDIETQSEIIPIMVQKIRIYTEDCQVMAGDAFGELLEQNVSNSAIISLIVSKYAHSWCIDTR